MCTALLKAGSGGDVVNDTRDSSLALESVDEWSSTVTRLAEYLSRPPADSESRLTYLRDVERLLWCWELLAGVDATALSSCTVHM